MDTPMEKNHAPPRRRPWLAYAACAVLLGSIATCVHAAPVYRCVDPNGRLTFRDIACPARAHQTKLEVSGQPLIDPHASRSVPSHSPRTSSRAHTRVRSRAARKRKTPMSWECRAADGEVFYRHSRCPGSIPGDGVVRIDWSGKRKRQPRNAWARIKVHGTRIPRAEACRRIASPHAIGRDGHRRDQAVEVYDHLLGRDPCDQT